MSSVRTLYFVRHGQSLANAGAIAMPDADIPLTALGQQQAQMLLARWPLRPARLYSSQIVRARQTAAVLAQHHGQQVQVLAELDEFSYLAYSTVAGLPREQVTALAQAYWDRADLAYRDGAGADSFLDFLARVDALLSRLPEFDDGSVFVGHGIWLGLLAWRLRGQDVASAGDMRGFRQFQTAMPMPNTAVYRLDIAGSGAARRLSMVEFDLI